MPVTIRILIIRVIAAVFIHKPVTIVMLIPSPQDFASAPGLNGRIVIMARDLSPQKEYPDVTGLARHQSVVLVFSLMACTFITCKPSTPSPGRTFELCILHQSGHTRHGNACQYGYDSKGHHQFDLSLNPAFPTAFFLNFAKSVSGNRHFFSSHCPAVMCYASVNARFVQSVSVIDIKRQNQGIIPNNTR
ncbi:MAG: hypothetical protein U5K27_21170 [Desulfotignum sp.]|nr:hypothetical protein [Desulfotignum sp.]